MDPTLDLDLLRSSYRLLPALSVPPGDEEDELEDGEEDDEFDDEDEEIVDEEDSEG